MRFPSSHRWTLSVTLSPQKVAQNENFYQLCAGISRRRVCMSVCLSYAGLVSKRLNVGSRKQRHVIAQGLWFSGAKSRWWVTSLSLEICAQTDPPPFEHNDFDQYPLIEPQPWELAKKVQIALIESRPRAFQWAIDEPCTLPLSPKTPLFLPVKCNFCRKKYATKFLCVNTSSSNVVAIRHFSNGS